MHLFDQHLFSQHSMDSSDCSTGEPYMDCDSMSNHHDDQSKPKRKREKLDHLTFEEKMNRRKMKNRISAQSARDRKKVKMNDLEGQIALLNHERNKVIKENEILRRRNDILLKENIALKSRVANSETGSDHSGRRSSLSEASPDSLELSNNLFSYQEKQLDQLIEPTLGPKGQEKLLDLAAVTSVETADLIQISLLKSQEERTSMLFNNQTSLYATNNLNQLTTACPLWIKQLICLFVMMVKSAMMSSNGSKVVTSNCLTVTLTNLCRQLQPTQMRELLLLLNNRNQFKNVLEQVLQQSYLQQLLLRQTPNTKVDPMLSQARLRQLDIEVFQ